MTTTIDPLWLISFILIASVFALVGIGIYLIFRNPDNPNPDNPNERKTRIALGIALFFAGGLLYLASPHIGLFLNGLLEGNF